MSEIFEYLEEELLKPEITEGFKEFYRELKTNNITHIEYAEKYGVDPTTPRRLGGKLDKIGLAQKVKRERNKQKGPKYRVEYQLSETGDLVSTEYFENLVSLTPNWFDVLNFLVESEESREEEFTPGFISKETGKEWTSVDRSLKKLEEMDYIEFSHYTSNKSSSVTYKLTEEGEEVLDHYKGNGEKEHSDLNLNEEDLEYLKNLPAQGEIKRSKLKEALNNDSITNIRHRMNKLAVKGKQGLVQIGKDEDIPSYISKPKGRETVRFWTREFPDLVYPKLGEVVRVGREVNEEDLNHYFYLGWKREWDLPKEKVREIIEDNELLERYVEIDDYRSSEGLAITGEFASLIERADLDPDFSKKIRDTLEKNLPWESEDIEDKLTGEVERKLDFDKGSDQVFQ